MLTLIDLLNEAGGNLKERMPRMHTELVKIVLDLHRDEGITARGIERALKEIAKTQMDFKYRQSKYDSYDRVLLRKEKKRDYQLLTLSTPRIIEILSEMQRKEKSVTKQRVAKNYHIYKPVDRIKEQSGFWHLQGLVAFHNLMRPPLSDGDDEQNVEELVNRIGVFVVYVFLLVSEEFGKELSEEELNKFRFDYVDSVVNARFMYNKIFRFFIPEGRSIAKADFERISSIMKAKYPLYIKKINEGAQRAHDALSDKEVMKRSKQVS